MVGCCLKDNFGEISPWNSRWFDGFLIHEKDVRYIFEGSGIDSLDAFMGQFRSKSKQETHESLIKKKQPRTSLTVCLSYSSSKRRSPLAMFISANNEKHIYKIYKSSKCIFAFFHGLKTNLPITRRIFLGSPGSSSSMARWFRRHRHISACLKAPGRQPVEHGAEKFLQNHWYSQNVWVKLLKKNSKPKLRPIFVRVSFSQ